MNKIIITKGKKNVTVTCSWIRLLFFLSTRITQPRNVNENNKTVTFTLLAFSITHYTYDF